MTQPATEAMTEVTTEGMSATAAVSMEAVIARFGDLPTLAPVAVEVIRLADDEDASLADIASAISNDPGLTIRLLRLANSGAYNRGNEVTNLNTAAGLLGIHTLKMVTLGFTLVADLTSERFDASILWRRSLATSVLARRFATDIDPALADDAFVAGILANIGKLALAEETVYSEKLASAGLWLLPRQEVDLLGFTSDQVTAGILASWGLPAVLADSVRYRNNPDAEDCTTELAKILRVADDAARLILIDDPTGQAGAIDALTASAAGQLGMTIGEIELIIAELKEQLDEIAGTFEFDAIVKTPITDIVQSAQTQLARLGLDLVSMLSEEQSRNESLIAINRQLEDEASTDALTGLPNRRTFDAYMANQVAGRLRNPRSTMLALVIFDLDHFKLINDSFGHAVGDEVLTQFGQRLLDCSRRGELAARIGGEEFALVLPDVESAAELQGAAERIRQLLGGEPVVTEVGPLTVTASVGGGYTRVVKEGSDEALFKAADKALYAAKANGRDQVKLASMT